MRVTRSEMATRQHADRAARKARLFDDVLRAMRGNAAIAWLEPLRDRALILGQLTTGTAFAVAVKLPQQRVHESLIAFLTCVNVNKGAGFVVREPASVKTWIRGLGL